MTSRQAGIASAIQQERAICLPCLHESYIYALLLCCTALMIEFRGSTDVG